MIVGGSEEAMASSVEATVEATPGIAETAEPSAEAANTVTESAPTNPEIKVGSRTLKFQYGQNGEISGHDLDGRYGILTSRAEQRSLDRMIDLENLNQKWPILRGVAVNRIERGGRQIIVLRDAISNLNKSGQGDSAEAKYLQRAANGIIAGLEKKYGDVFK